MTKWSREKAIKEVATKIAGADFENQESKERAENIDINGSIEDIEAEILLLAWDILPRTVSPAIQAVINLLSAEAYKKD